MTKIFFKSSPVSPNHLCGNATNLRWGQQFTASPAAVSPKPVALSFMTHAHRPVLFQGALVFHPVSISHQLYIREMKVQKVKSLSCQGLLP